MVSRIPYLKLSMGHIRRALHSLCSFSLFLSPPHPQLHGHNAVTTQPQHSHNTLMFECKHCQATFETQGQHTYHSRECRQSFVLQFPQGKVEVRRRADGTILCECTHPNCPQPFNKIETLKKHLQRAGTHWRSLDKDQLVSKSFQARFYPSLTGVL
jgi:hypothetical protein